MTDTTWVVRVNLCPATDAVYAEAVVAHGPALLSGQGRAALGAGGEVTSEAEAAAARRALVDLAQSIRDVWERPHPMHADQA